jgi:hypothetical protein
MQHNENIKSIYNRWKKKCKDEESLGSVPKLIRRRSDECPSHMVTRKPSMALEM